MDVSSSNHDQNQNLAKKHSPNDFENVESVADFIRQRLSIPDEVHCGIICGSGLGTLADSLRNARSMSYAQIPGFAPATVHGHKGQLVFGELQSKNVVCLQGRVHPYEGHSLSKCAFPVRVMKQLGAEILITTSAVGGINPSFKVGDLMLVRDHIFLAGFSLQGPLVGPNDERLGPRFPSMNNVYDNGLRDLAKKVAGEINVALVEGVYAMVGGPHFETPAEIKLLQVSGADVVGMSVCHEAVVAKHGGMRTLCMALITNMAQLEQQEEAVHDIHEEVLEIGNQAAKKTAELVKNILKHI